MREDIFQMYLGELSGIKSCDEEENNRLLRALASGDPGARDRLIEGNLKTVLEMVRDYVGRGIPAGGLVQEANMALVVAVREYEGGGFDSFLKDRVRAALLNAVERQSMETKTARKMVDRVNRLQDISAELAEELGREATVEELARRMELTEEEIREAMKVTMDAMTLVER